MVRAGPGPVDYGFDRAGLGMGLVWAYNLDISTGYGRAWAQKFQIIWIGRRLAGPIYIVNVINHLNPRPDGPLDFPPPDGGGVFEHPPSISAPTHRKTKQKTAFESSRKIISKSFRSFLAQIKIEVTRGQNSKIFLNGFRTIKSLILKVEQRF